MASKITKFEGILRALPDAIRSAYRRVLPNAEDEIMQNLLAKRDVIANSPFGFTINPRTGEVLQPRVDYGYMMATVPEQASLNRLAVKPEDLTEADLQNLLQNPYYMDQLTRGAYLGGWFDDSTGEFVIDPSRRFLSQDMSVLGGIPAQQKAGFDLLGFDEYKLPALGDSAARDAAYNEALRRLLARSLGGGAAIGTGLGIMQGRE